MPDKPTDHDLLIAHSVKIDHLCALIRKVDKSISEYTDRLEGRCGLTHTAITDTHKELFKKVDKKVDNVTFRWLIGILVTGFIIVAGMAGSALTDSYINGAAILRIEQVLSLTEEEVEP